MATGCVLAPAPGVAPLPQETVPPAPRAEYDVLAGVEQIYVIGALEGDRIVLEQLGGGPRVEGVADRLGSFVGRGFTQGATVEVTNVDAGDRRGVKTLRADDHPGDEFYSATRMREGLNYVPMRDGITLAAVVRPPIGATIADGPFPTVIEYSGYQVAGPAEPVTGRILAGALGLPVDPLAPSGDTDLGSLLMRLAGYAVVSVQLRGSGCSGGESDLFDLPTRLDGYDIIETVARQWWVRGSKVGMVGISFSGLSQIAVAETQPPSLAALAPFSFLGSMYDVAHPGGIYNDGFGRTWLADRVKNARPAPDPGALPYANELVRRDPNCRDNQRLRLQTRDGVNLVRDQNTFGEEFERRDFRPWMERVDVPTFASLQFEDEETSSYAMLTAQELLGANDRVWLNLANGTHNDSVSPETITELFEFLDIYVARQAPTPKLLVYLLSDVIFGEGSVQPPLPRTWGMNRSRAQADFESRDRVRYLLELPSGSMAGSHTGSRWQFTSSSFPVPGSTERTWFFGESGALVEAPGAPSSDEYRPDPSARRHTIAEGGQPFRWIQVPDGAGVSYLSEPLDEDVVLLGPAALDLHIESNAADTDLGVTISEVRPDGQEMLAAYGVQRASMREVNPARSSATRPAHTFTNPLPLQPGVNQVPVQVLPAAHVLRAGSQLRVSISAVGGDFQRWAFDSIDPSDGSTVNRIHTGAATPSSITITSAPLTGYPTPLLPCPSAGKACRTFVPAANGG